MTIKFVKGVKGENDWIILVNDKQISYSEVAEIVQHLCWNEDGLYPPPKFRGGQMPIDMYQTIYDMNKTPCEKCGSQKQFYNKDCEKCVEATNKILNDFYLFKYVIK